MAYRKPGVESTPVGHLTVGSRSRMGADGFNYQSNSIGGLVTSLTGGEGRYAMPGFNHPGISQMIASPTPGMYSKRPPPLTVEGLAKQIGNVLPANKRPRLGPSPVYVPTQYNPYMNQPITGRGITPSAIMDMVGQAEQAISNATESDSAIDFDAIQRQVHWDRGTYAFAQYLMGQIVFIREAGYQDTSGRTVVPLRTPNMRAEEPHFPIMSARIAHSSGTYELLSIVVMNYALRLDDYYRPEEGGWMEPLDVLSLYKFDGTVRVDPRANPNDVFRDGNELVFTISQDKRDSLVKNIWGNVEKDQQLWLLIKRLPANKAPKEYTLVPDQGHRRNIPPAPDADGYHPNPIQVIPWSNWSKQSPTTEDLMYEDETDGTTKLGIAIKVGWALNSSAVSNGAAHASCWYNATSMHSLPTVDLMMNQRIAYI